MFTQMDFESAANNFIASEYLFIDSVAQLLFFIILAKS